MEATAVLSSSTRVLFHSHHPRTKVQTPNCSLQDPPYIHLCHLSPLFFSSQLAICAVLSSLKTPYPFSWFSYPQFPLPDHSHLALTSPFSTHSCLANPLHLSGFLLKVTSLTCLHKVILVFHSSLCCSALAHHVWI